MTQFTARAAAAEKSFYYNLIDVANGNILWTGLRGHNEAADYNHGMSKAGKDTRYVPKA